MVQRDQGITPVQAAAGGWSRLLPGHEVDLLGDSATGGSLRQGEAASPARDEAGEAIKARLAQPQSQLSIQMDPDTGKMIVRLTDPQTGEVIRQLPPEEMLKLAKAIDRYLGLLVDRHS